MPDQTDSGKSRRKKNGNFLKRIGNSRPVAACMGALIAYYIRFIFKSGRLIRNASADESLVIPMHPVILTVWHGQGFMAVPTIPPEMKTKVLVTRHGDGDIASQTMSRLGVGLIRGAGAAGRKRHKDKGGAQALRAMVRALNEGYTVVITADMPGAPARQAGMGVVTLAKLSGRPILPVALSASRYLTLNTWSRFVINLPFSRLGLAVGDPIYVSRQATEAEMETARQAVERGLNEMTEKAYQLSGAEPPPLPAAAERRPDPGLLLNAYTVFSKAVQPLTPLLLKARSRRGKEIEARLGERMGQPGVARPEGSLWWFHAASVGETNAILPLIHLIKKRRPALNILLTTVTVTSARIAASRLPQGAVHQFAPLDTPAFVNRFFDAWRPDLALFTESEIWPNLLLEADRRHIPLVLLNARMSDRSFSRWKRMKSLSRPLFSRFDLILAQTARLARRLEKLGAPRVIAAGNIKFDAPPPPVDKTQLAELTARIGTRPVFLAASTHPGEDEIIIEAHRAALARIPPLLTIIVPRHPERGADVESVARRAGLATARRSNAEELRPDTSIYVADTIGELGLFYALAPIAFIGGSLVRHGGQNPVEAVKLGTAVLSGPHYYNFKDAYRALEQCGGCRIVSDAESLARAITDLHLYPATAEAMRERAERDMAALSGALERTLEALEPYLPPAERLALPQPLGYVS